MEKKIIFTGVNGMHARPGGQLIKIVKQYTPTIVTIRNGDLQAKGSSLIQILKLNIKTNDEIIISSESEEAVQAVSEFLESIVN